MSKKGFTLIEMIIAIALLGIIMAAVSVIFTVSIKNYRNNIQKSSFQKDINFVIDNISKDIKLATSVPTEYDPPTYTLSENTLILALPTIDESGNFVYVGNSPEKDYYIYYLSGNELKRKTFSSPLGIRAIMNEEEISLLSNVSQLQFSYLPGMSAADQVKVALTLSADINGRSITVSGERTANLRNKQ